MTLAEFTATFDSPTAPAVPTLLRALWHAARGNWDEAHRLAQDIDTPDGAWVHAYLHRKEGDDGNARYWYHRAKQPEATDALDSEWSRLVSTLLTRT